MPIHTQPRDQTGCKDVNPQFKTSMVEGAQADTNGHAHTNGRAVHHTSSPFDDVADQLKAVGYAPLALERKRPVDDQWSRWCRTPPTTVDIATRKGRGHNVGVAMGLGGTMALDVDTDDPAINAAIRSVIRESNVAKKGKKGRTDVYRVSGPPLASRRFCNKNGEIIVEILADGRQSAIPPSIHPDTKQSYEWLTPTTLLNTPAERLTECPPDIAERLHKALEPWLRPEPEPRPQRCGPPPVLTEAMQKRHRAWALKKLDARVRELAAKGKPGRNDLLFKLTCGLGAFIPHGIITDAELRGPALDACQKNGLISTNGRHDCEKTIDRALRYSLGDALEDLEDRPRQPHEYAPKQGARPKEPAGSSREQESRPNKTGAGAQPTPCLANEDAIATGFAERHVGELRYCHDWGTWLKWDGSRWERERRRLAFHYARHMARDANAEGKATPAKASTAAGVERFAQADPRLATINEDWDRDPWLLATPTAEDKI
jgi:hypothetical protein